MFRNTRLVQTRTIGQRQRVFLAITSAWITFHVFCIKKIPHSRWRSTAGGVAIYGKWTVRWKFCLCIPHTVSAMCSEGHYWQSQGTSTKHRPQELSSLQNFSPGVNSSHSAPLGGVQTPAVDISIYINNRWHQEGRSENSVPLDSVYSLPPAVIPSGRTPQCYTKQYKRSVNRAESTERDVQQQLCHGVTMVILVSMTTPNVIAAPPVLVCKQRRITERGRAAGVVTFSDD